MVGCIIYESDGEVDQVLTADRFQELIVSRYPSARIKANQGQERLRENGSLHWVSRLAYLNPAKDHSMVDYFGIVSKSNGQRRLQARVTVHELDNKKVQELSDLLNN